MVHVPSDGLYGLLAVVLAEGLAVVECFTEHF